MANNSIITYVQPKEKFLKVANRIVEKFAPEVVGVYCKVIQLSGGKSLSISFIAKKIGVSLKKVRRVIVILEEAGYIVRNPMKDGKGAFAGWNYCVYAESVPKDKRSHAGRKSELDEIGLDHDRTYPKTDKSENGKENILSNTRVLSNNKDLSIDKDKEVLSNDNTKKEPVSKLSEEERIYEEKMRERFPRIMGMEQPLTLKQAKELKERYDTDLLADIMESMENWKKLKSQNVSAYKTIIKWCEKELDKL